MSDASHASRTTVYSGRVTNWPLVWVVNALAVLLVGLSGLPEIDLVGTLPVVAVLILVNLTMTSVRTTAGPGGVAVRYGVLGLPRFGYPVERIAHAEAVQVPFRQMGSWGVHWSPWRGTRLTIRSGPALRLQLRGGLPVTISAVDPEDAAAVINGLLPADAGRAQ